MGQIEIVSLQSLVPENHLYKTFNNIWNFKNTSKKLLITLCSVELDNVLEHMKRLIVLSPPNLELS
jgi:hypothetical protein